jgi:NAD(P)-dependent dehydrogenase (short-subunit alcohol dehydrogenase family)
MMDPIPKIVIITGATSGIGFAVARRLLWEGFSVFAVGSREERCTAAKNKIWSELPNADITFFYADCSSLQAVRGLADQIIQALAAKNGGSFFALINNAGGVRDHYTPTVDGLEYTFALNHLSGFLLTYLLRPYFQGGVLLFTSSYAHQHMRIHWNDILFQRFFNVLLCYKQSKLANVMMAFELQKRLKKDGIRVFAIDPGLVKTEIGDKGTKGLAKMIWALTKRQGTSPELPALTYSYLLHHPESVGLYFKNCQSVRYNPQVDRTDQTKRLFALSEQLCCIHFDSPPTEFI